MYLDAKLKIHYIMNIWSNVIESSSLMVFRNKILTLESVLNLVLSYVKSWNKWAPKKFPILRFDFQQIIFYLNNFFTNNYNFQLHVPNRFLEDNVWYLFLFLFLFFSAPSPKQTSLYICPRQWIQAGKLEYICILSSLFGASTFGGWLPHCSPDNRGSWRPWI